MQFSLKTKITTPIVEETRAFYERVFSMTVAEEWDSPGDKGVILAFENGAGEAYLEIYNGPAGPGFDSLGLQFKTDDLDAFVSSLPDDIECEGPKPRPWGSPYLYLRDPNGIQVIVYDGGL